MDERQSLVALVLKGPLDRKRRRYFIALVQVIVGIKAVQLRAQRDGLHDADDGNGDICRACKTRTYTYVNTE